VRLCQFDNYRLGIVDKDLIRDVTEVFEELPRLRYPLLPGDALVAALPELREKMVATANRALVIPISKARLLGPVANPSKVVGAPVNYKKHLAEVVADPAVGTIPEGDQFLGGRFSRCRNSPSRSSDRPRG
jgi:2,4-didehydro-3-deoxy-L-rhamnonate hydrolase